MTHLTSFDGGNAKANAHASFAAHFYAGTLGLVEEMTLGQARLAACGSGRPDRVAVEVPDYLKKGVPPKIIFGLAWNVCRIAYTLAAGRPVAEYTVNSGLDSDWIGGVGKPVLHRRIWRVLDASERRVFPAGTADDIERASEIFARTKKITKHKSFNTLDAAGVGLRDLGRIKKGGAKP